MYCEFLIVAVKRLIKIRFNRALCIVNMEIKPANLKLDTVLIEHYVL